MLVKHSAIYLLARGLPGVVNFVAIAFYTRLLSCQDYGRYALVLAGVGLFNVVFFQWLRLSLLRFFPASHENPKLLLSSILAGFYALSLLTGALGLVLVCLWPDPTWRGLLMIAVPLLWAQAWFELNLELVRSRLQPQRYGLMSGLKAISALGIGVLLVLFWGGPYAPLVGLLLGMMLVAIFLARREWVGIRPDFSMEKTRGLLSYGLPLVATFLLGFVVSASDRFLIAAFMGEGPAGIYAAGYDIAQQSLTLLMVTANLAAYPLLVRTFEKNGLTAAQAQAKKSGTILFAIAMPASAGFAVLAPNIAAVMVGPAFREQAALLLPIIALSSLIAGAKAFHFDLAFQLGRWTTGQVWVLGIAAAVNVGLNIWWIPSFGLIGAAYATVVAYSVGLLLSVIMGRKVFVISFPIVEFVGVAVATAIMVLGIWPLMSLSGGAGLAIQICVGLGAYVLSILALNVANSRHYSVSFIKRLWG